MSDSVNTRLLTRHLGFCDYDKTYQAMRDFTHHRDHDTSDELWLLQHYPVFTQGKAGKAEHILKKSDIPIIQSDRGGQITYHAPGQLVVYFLLDLHRRHMNIRQLLDVIEQSVIALLAQYNITGHLINKQPGVYVDHKKIASLGIHIHKGRSYHGLSLNVNMDLQPFTWINPCGIKNLGVTQLADLGCDSDVDTIGAQLRQYIIKKMEN
ncbi:MAG: lipoyl(octanoyl) transferase LipB [Pseudomonadota bacterium]